MMAKFIKKSQIPFFLCLCFVFFYLSCSLGAPTIKDTKIQVLAIQNEDESFTPRLSVFVSFEDPDGHADLLQIQLVHNETELQWIIPKEQAMVRNFNNKRWTGSHSLSGLIDSDGFYIPYGLYSLIVTDLAGNEAVKSLSIAKASFPSQLPVQFTLGSDLWTVTFSPESTYFDAVYLMLLDEHDALLYSYKVAKPKKGENENLVQTGRIDQLKKLATKVKKIQCYVENPSAQLAMLYFPIKIE